MDKAEKLSKVIQTNIPMVLRIKKRGGSYPEKVFENNKPTDRLTGKMQFLYFFEDASGRELSHYASETQEDDLRLFLPGESVQVVRSEKVNEQSGKRISFYQFTPVEGAEARSAATPQGQSNTAVTRQVEKIEQKKADEDEKWFRIDTSKIVFGYMNTALAAGKPVKDAAELAYEAYQYQNAVVDKIVAARSPEAA